MMHPIAAGTRVSVRQTILEPSERAPGVPPDTGAVPYEVLIRGVLVEPAQIGEQAEICTAIGRSVRGQLADVEPADPLVAAGPPAALARTRAAIDQLRSSLWKPT